MYLSSRSNPKIKYIRSLHQKKHRDQQNEFLIEGQNLVEEALQSNWPLVQVLYLSSVSRPEAAAGVECLEVSAEAMAWASTLASPPDYLAVAKQQAIPTPQHCHPCILVTAPLQDPGNLGALLRLADAMHLTGVWVVGSGVDPFHPKVIRGAMGSALRVPIRILDSSKELLQLKEQGWQLLATDAHGKASSFSLAFPEKTALLLGSEGPGLPTELAELADLSVRIPIHTQVESLNVVTAAAMLLHEYCRQYPLETQR
ncbi:rRNA methyltransferase [bacterium (Candidatus Blackallbacteria) CG17_big_fil_post_rev_8_21_14_2_50_48_46]|uniref:rRNA methyltransferase n=1 Tax=bacterium (Candidatus Blackallbacteria) CG17_big_fil_post_rev_8_21_14_2_50_48_46 TaxID=2014261 RepID=A0A2M7FX19_9BACT|nr:MAG: rRNA methyltransferase [bacterium (Candidatus Blackallbacteria) CG18_big_fil_WC_8_21_14_2_50_49_26]PIW13808.1 MAG: rRNA methyltransferase [bacterium (Candidatus Blackallbacteria) CG17_big_fil_post_rev_8_21_14_2_50_48_46]PIW45034.1 MAG: rRNA methyltransferase [bacterium (Candidatus Blackallbacteria) CG13_big_fil_rev_8_21_14_2_50_49_14]